MESNRLSATQAVERLARRELSAEQLLRDCLAHIEAREPIVQAWTARDADAALQHARELDRSPIRGVLHGLPFGVKDVFATHDLPTSCGSAIYAGHRPPADAAAVALCRQAGAIVAGKTVTTEFASYQPGPTRNPNNPAHTPGGSSSGSAAAVADYMVPFALGTQTAGSIIRPAAYCGVVGYKPSLGLIQRAGLKTIADSLDTIGGFARTVDDVALFASVMMGDARLCDLAYDGRPRIGFYRASHWPNTEECVQEAGALAASALSGAGARIEEIDLPPVLAALAQAQADIMAVEMAQSLAYEHGRYRDRLSDALLAVLDAGTRVSAAEHQANLQRVQDGRAQVERWFEQYDVLLVPSATGEAPLYESGTGDPIFCRMWSALGTPCVHLPFHTGPRGLPVGLQAIGRRDDDRRTLAIARWMLGVLRPGQ
ncbi:amidase [Bordetella sp. 02P26C-1]|uniref:amidase n=1 Tax=Bordetella sp. 02P26C-1 TaxID=2683195 RepID=UPI001355EB7D|nr:amidase [Bordetella sp. 02P26C-1]MVW78721.1 amidase [Bordetella sp. 02P26C-1]